MKFINTTILPPPPLIQFIDVPNNSLLIDCSGDLLLKLESNSACRIAEKGGMIKAQLFNPCQTWGVEKILPYDKVEF